MGKIKYDQTFKDLWVSPELYWTSADEDEIPRRIWSQVIILKTKEGVSLSYQSELDTYSNHTKLIVSYEGIDHQYHEVLKYKNENFAIHNNCVGKCSFHNVDTIMIMKLAALYVDEWTCKDESS